MNILLFDPRLILTVRSAMVGMGLFSFSVHGNIVSTPEDSVSDLL